MTGRDNDYVEDYGEEEESEGDEVDQIPNYKSFQEDFDSLRDKAKENYGLNDDDPEKWDSQQQRDHAEDMQKAARENAILPNTHSPLFSLSTCLISLRR